MSSFAPSQYSMTPDGRKWRKCAAACVVNSAGDVLVGERLKISGAWGAPQGGMDDRGQQSETVMQAASREAFEECGLRCGEHIQPVAAQEDESLAVRYEAGGWLKEAGFAGQQLHWALFFVVDPTLDRDCASVCDLSGQNGEAPEFARVRWQPLDEVIANMWPAKRGPYQALQTWATPLIEEKLLKQR